MKVSPDLRTSIHRNPDVQAIYVAHMERKLRANDTSCDMCRLIKNNRVSIPLISNTSDESRSLKSLDQVCVVENEFPYDVYDGRRVLAHHLLVPVDHFATSSELPQDVKKELRDTQDALLDSGMYDSSLVRSTHSPGISVPGHLHMHLVKLGSKVIKQDFDARLGKNDIEYELTQDS